jgi:hypothetical protein
MLIIRRNQLDAMGQRLEDRFVEVLARHLETELPTRAAELGPALRDEIRRGIAQAREFGLKTEQDIGAFVHFRTDAALDFDERPDFAWAVDCLRSPDADAGDRIDRLFAEWIERRSDRAG